MDDMENDSECKNQWLCAALGFFVPLFGVVIAAVFDMIPHAEGDL